MKRTWWALGILSVFAAVYLGLHALEPRITLPQSVIAPNNATVVAVGDIACPPWDKTTATTCRQADTAALTALLHPDAALLLGDLQHGYATLEDYKGIYDKTWGVFNSIAKPVPGNHEYWTFSGSGYFDYFGATAGEKFKGYYSYDINDWHIVALNSEIDVSPVSTQRRWLRADLAAHPAMCTLAYWHRPRFSTGIHPTDVTYKGLWQDLYAAGADVVLGGHSHDYERFLPQTPDGKTDAQRGIVQFVVGTGGTDFTSFTGTDPHEVTRQNTTFGVLKLTLLKQSLQYEFMGIPGQPAYTDKGLIQCHK